MSADELEFILRSIRLPMGTLLADDRTFRLGEKDFEELNERSQHILRGFEKLLVLSDGNGNVVGGVLFYNRYDVQVTTFPEYRECGYMSAIHKNGVLRSELYPNQEIKIYTGAIESLDDLRMKCHLLNLIGIKPSNTEELVRFGTTFVFDGKKYSADEFRKEFGL